jgi:hypothetical protein
VKRGGGVNVAGECSREWWTMFFPIKKPGHDWPG